MTAQILVSIIIPTYNRAEFLPRSINSVINQTYKNWELIIVDDRSTDNTLQLVKKYAEKDKRIKYIKNTHKKGPAGAKNQGIEIAKGELLAFLDSDDEWLKDKLDIQINYLLRNPQIKLVGSDSWIILNKQKTKFSERFDSINLNKQAVIETIIKDFDLWMQTSTIIAYREIFKKLGLFRENLIRCEDVEMWLKISRKFDIGYIDSQLINYYSADIKFKDYEPERKLLKCYGYYHLKFLKCLKNYKLNKIEKKLIRQSKRKVHWNIGYFYRKHKKLKSLSHYLISMFYEYHPIQIEAIKKLFIPGYYKKTGSQKA